jgi:hypothetical protein
MSPASKNPLYGRLSVLSGINRAIYVIDILSPSDERQRAMFQLLRDWEETFSVVITDDRSIVPIELRSSKGSAQIRIISLHESVRQLEGALSELRKHPQLSARAYATMESTGGNTMALILQEPTQQEHATM